MSIAIYHILQSYKGTVNRASDWPIWQTMALRAQHSDMRGTTADMIYAVLEHHALTGGEAIGSPGAEKVC